MTSLAALLKYSDDQPRADNGQWGEGSTVKGKDGAPLVVYHGSVAPAGTPLDPTALPVRERTGPQGTYFTSDGMTASNYMKAPGSKERGHLVTATLRMANPLDITAAVKAGQKKGMDFKDAKASALTQLGPQHDGVIYRGNGVAHDEYIVFHAAQIHPVARKATLASLVKYSDDQPRAANGQWGEGDGGGGKPSLDSLFSGSLGHERSTMPQIPAEHKAAFIAELHESGVTTTNETVDARSLLPTQKDFKAENIAFLRGEESAGNWGKGGGGSRIMVAREGRILDGHHRWAYKAQDGQKIDVLRVNAPIHELMDRAKGYNLRHGIEARTTKISLASLIKYSDDQPRDDNGRWSGGGDSGGGGGSGGTTSTGVGPSFDRGSGPVGRVDVRDFIPPRMMATIARESAKAVEDRRTLTPEQAARATSDLASRVAAANAAKPAYDTKMQEIGQKLGATVMLAKVKGGDRLLVKHVYENATPSMPNGDPSKMQDLVRGSLVVNKPADIAAAVAAVHANFDVVRMKDRFKEPIPGSNYKDVLMNVRLPNGAIGEIQVHIPEMIAAKDVGHKLYEISRDLPDSSSEKRGLVALQNKIYERAARHNTRRTGS